MANASLQIGNGNWAIKEDNLLGYSKAGTRFLPIPITMTRATLGTRVNPSGLIEDVALLGSELVSCGNFECADPESIWTLTQATITNGSLNLSTSDGSYTAATQTLGTIGNVYKISLDVSDIVGTISVAIGGGTDVDITTNGTHTAYITSASTTFEIKRKFGIGNVSATIDNVSVKEATIDDLARVDYTDGTASLLVEPQRTNLLPYSEDFSQWSDTGVQVNINSTISPSGTENASTITGSTTNSRHNVAVSTISGSVSASFSVFAKAKELRYLQIASANSINQYANFDLLSGTIGTIGSGFSNVKIESLDNDWYKISLVSNSQYNSIYLSLASSLTASWLETYSMANNSDSLYLWGAQVEEGSYPTSYIKTQGSTVTRNQDEYTKTGISDKINSEEGVLFVEMAALSDDITRRAITLSDGTTNNRIVLRYKDSSSTIECFIVVANNLYGLISENSYTITNFLKIAYKWKAGDFALWINGVEVDTSASATSFGADVLTQMQFNDGDGAGNEYFGKVKQLQVFKTALSDSELATLTTI
jgi:hypothetical protein